MIFFSASIIFLPRVSGFCRNVAALHLNPTISASCPRAKLPPLNKKQEVNLTKQRIGQDNEDSFLAWLEQVGTSHLPAPMNHNDRLYLKALWAIYSEQELLDIKREPSWFRTREKVKKALEELDVKLVRGEVETIKMDAESIIDDMEDTMTNTLVRKLRSEVKELKEKLAAERIARKDAELKAKQNELLAQQVHNGKMASYQ